MSMRNRLKPIANSLAVAFGGLMLASAGAQQPQVQEEVVVTGTRLPPISVEGPSPITVINTKDIKLDGLSKVEEILINLPQAYADQGAATSNGATGTATVNLRNLGAQRNLVLLNGHRLPPGSPTQGGYPADLNQIPAPLIQRVELLTGGASAVYGSDAISGVVNFIMNDKFEGIQLDLGYSFFNHQQNSDTIAAIVAARQATNPSQFRVPSDVGADGKVRDFSLLLGGNFAGGKGNATAFLQYKKEDPVLQAFRDFSACALNPGDVFTCGGSSTSFPGRFFLNQGSFTVANAQGGTRPFSAATDQFNFGPYNYYRRPSEKYAFSAFAHLDISPAARAYTELSFHDDHTVAQIAPSGLFIFDASGPNGIRFENPLLSADWRSRLAASNALAGLPFAAAGDTADILIGRRNIEGGGRQDDIRHTSYRMLAGLKGEILKNWNYDLFAQAGQVNLSRIYRNDFSNTRIGRALNAVTDPSSGQTVCASVLDGTDPNCVPYNLWTLGGPTAAALNYLATPGLANGSTQQIMAGANISADLGNYGVKLPTAKSGIAVVLGAEYRRERLVLETDTAFSTGDLAGQGGATIGRRGVTKVTEAFGEIRVPLVEDVPFAKSLSVNASYRNSSYKDSVSANTHGFGLEWTPVQNYLVRGSYQRAIRAANLEELFLAQGNNLFGMNEDPCGPAKTATFAECQRSGITAAQYGSPLLDSPAGQYGFLQGGNPALNPEKANSYTIGLVMTPTRNLAATIDYWHIKINDTIDNAPPATILNECLKNNRFCDRVRRDRLGSLWALPDGVIVALNDNLGRYETSGIDLAVNYTHRMGSYGSLAVNFNGTWTEKFIAEPIKGLGNYDCVGFFGVNCGTPTPEWRHKARLTWSTPWNADVALTWRHIDKVEQETLSSNPLLTGPTAKTDRELAKRDYFDVAGSWNATKNLIVRAGINNVLDKDPPIVSSILADPAIFGNGNTFPQVYDTLGRLVFVTLSLKF